MTKNICKSSLKQLYKEEREKKSVIYALMSHVLEPSVTERIELIKTYVPDSTHDTYGRLRRTRGWRSPVPEPGAVPALPRLVVGPREVAVTQLFTDSVGYCVAQVMVNLDGMVDYWR